MVDRFRGDAFRKTCLPIFRPLKQTPILELSDFGPERLGITKKIGITFCYQRQKFFVQSAVIDDRPRRRRGA